MHGLGDREERLVSGYDLPVGGEAQVPQQGNLGAQDLRHAAAVGRGVQVQDARPPQGLGQCPQPFDRLAARGGLVVGYRRVCLRLRSPAPRAPPIPNPVSHVFASLMRAWGRSSTGPFAALSTLVETLPSLARRTGPSPRLPTARSVCSPSCLLRRPPNRPAAGSPTSSRILGRTPRVLLQLCGPLLQRSSPRA